MRLFLKKVIKYFTYRILFTNLSFMKSSISKLLLASAFALSVHANAATITQTATGLQISGELSVTYSDFLAFDSNQGTLNSVTFYVDSASITGGIAFIQGSSGTSSLIRGYSSYLTLEQGDASGFYNGVAEDLYTNPVNLSISNQVMPRSVDRNRVVGFLLSSGQYLVTSSSPESFDVSSGDYTFDGLGGLAPSFTLQGSFSTDATTTGTTSRSDYSEASTVIDIRLVYDYTPTSAVPEPSTYGIGLGVLALAVVAIRRRNKVKA
jgi:hypothetical protein